MIDKIFMFFIIIEIIFIDDIDQIVGNKKYTPYTESCIPNKSSSKNIESFSNIPIFSNEKKN